MKKLGLLLILAALFATESNARCLRKKRMHEHKNVVRCEYNQDDIYRAYAKNPGRYGCLERYKRCIYCGCKIEEHTLLRPSTPSGLAGSGGQGKKDDK